MQLDITVVLRCFDTEDIEDTARSQNVGSVLVLSQRIQQCFYLGIKTSYCKGKKEETQVLSWLKIGLSRTFLNLNLV